jgi:polyisoprenoid-binding protein YceI
MRKPNGGGIAFVSVVGLVLAVASTRVDAQERVAGAASSAPASSTAPAPSPAPSAGAAAPTQAAYHIDTRKSQFSVQAQGGGVLGVFAHDHRFEVRDFGGTITPSAKGLPGATLDLVIVAASLTLVDKVDDGERKEIEGSMRDKVLETAKFPKVTFRTVSAAVDGASGANQNLTIVGNLWLHGVGHKITMPVTVAMQGDTVRATGSYKLRQTDYGISPYAAAAGTIRVKDEVTLSFDIVATR